MLKFYNIVKIYNKKTMALNNFNMHVEKGSIHALLGHNGAGKTTAFMIANKFIPFDSGEILINNKKISKLTKSEMKKITLVADKLKLYKELTVKEIMYFFLNLFKIRNKKNVIEKISEEFELNDFLNKKIKNLSTGMYKKTLIATSLLGNPELVFLDEPFAGVDPIMLKKISGIIKDYNEKHGITFIISSHNLSEVELISDHITIIKNGYTIISESIDSIFKKYNLEKSFTVNYMIDNHVKEDKIKNEVDLYQFLKKIEHENGKILHINENKITLNDLYNKIYNEH